MISKRHEDIINFFKTHSKSETVTKFTGIHFSRRGIYAIIQRYEKTGSIERKVGSGRKPVKMTSDKRKRLLQRATLTVGQSVRKLGREMNVSKSYVHKMLKTNNIVFRKRKEAPKVTPTQIIRQKARLQNLAKIVVEKTKTDFVLDDESYFTLTGAMTSGYYVDQKKFGDVPDNIRLKFREKFTVKVLVWATVSRRGISNLYIRKWKSVASNSDIYISECLTKRLLPYLNEKYPAGHFIFWPDLASCHYAKASLKCLEDNKIPFVKKDSNPPCAPQIRPIEKFWAHLKEKVYEKGWTADSEDQLIRRIKTKAKQFNNLYFRTLFANFRQRIMLANSYGLNSLI